ncbi:MAG: PEP-CTERM sorting domain-containing protein [bacterium]
MKRIGLVALMITGMICMTQSAQAYQFINNGYVAQVAADGDLIDFAQNVPTGNDVVDTMSATIYYSLTPGGVQVSKGIGADFTNMWTTPVLDLTPETNSIPAGSSEDYLEVASLYRFSARGAGDTLDVKVRTKLEDDKAYLAQRYWVEYDENGGLDLFDVKLEVTMVCADPLDAKWVGSNPVYPEYYPNGITSDWGSTTGWPGSVDSAEFWTGPNGEKWRVQGYVPNIPDGAHINPPNTIVMDWNLGNLGNVPAPAVVGALELRTDIVPEPCTMALLGAGLFGLFGIRRRKA